MSKIATSNSKEGLTRLINEYYYSTNWEVIESEKGNLYAFNNKLQQSLGRVEYKNKKYTYHI